jgi:hypothetical protein
MKSIVLAVIGSLAASSVLANELVLTNGAASKSAGQQFAIDFISSGQAVDLVARVNIPDAENAKVDLSNCAKSLPSGFTSVCSVAKGMVIVQVFGASEKASVLPKGRISLGVFSVAYSDGAPRSFTFAQNDLSDAQAADVSLATKVF